MNLNAPVLLLAMAVAGCSGTDGNKDAGGVDAGGGGGDGGGGACSMAGTWQGPVPGGPMAGQTNNWQFQTGGITLATIGAATTINGTWAVDAGVLSLTDTSSVPSTIACPQGQVGTYSMAFSANCGTVTLHATAEPCAGRQVGADGFAGTRQ